MIYDINLITKAANEHKQLLVDTIVKNKQSATGRTIAAIRAQVLSGAYGYEILGPSHVYYMQYGRGPTKSSGDGSLYEKILEWVNAKGVVFPDGIQKSKYTLQERTAKRITYFIHKNGTRLFRTGATYDGVRDPLLPVFDDSVIREIAGEIIQDATANIESDVFKILKQLTA